MINTCKNCAGRMKYDINTSGLSCVSCGYFIPSKDFKLLDEQDSSDEVMMDCNVFLCKTCGAEITATDTEGSTFCVSCGNPTIVFDRITKIKRPKKIIPFKVTKERAMQKVEEIKKGRFVPDAFKNAKIEQLHGVYVPYYVSNVEYDGSMTSLIVKKDDHDNTVTYYGKTSAYATFKWVTTDASVKLNDHTSKRLEPYSFSEAVDFNENYLVGFYSDIADAKKEDIIKIARERVIDDMDDRLYADSPYEELVDYRHSAEVYQEPVLALFPLWAFTISHENTPYTILVNGQTGKVIGGLPYDKKKYYGLWAIITAILTVVIAPLLYIPAAFVMNAETPIAAIIYALILIGLSVFAYLRSRKQFALYDKSIERTTDKDLNEYSTDRNGGNDL